MENTINAKQLYDTCIHVIVYDVKWGHLTRFKDNGQPIGKQWVIICDGLPDVLADSFLYWANKTYDLSNQDDKPFDYIAKKPKVEILKDAWEMFFSAYRCIKRAEKLYKINQSK